MACSYEQNPAAQARKETLRNFGLKTDYRGLKSSSKRIKLKMVDHQPKSSAAGDCKSNSLDMQSQ